MPGFSFAPLGIELQSKTVPTGDSRFVLCLPAIRVAVKFPRFRNLRFGLHNNRWEREMWHVWRPQFGWKSLCPIRFADPWGFVVVMQLAGKQASPDEAEDQDPREFLDITSEGKPDDYRWLNGRIVVVDYGLNSEESATMSREDYRRRLALKQARPPKQPDSGA